MNCQTGCACPRHFPKPPLRSLPHSPAPPSCRRSRVRSAAVSTAAEDLRFMRMALDEARQGDFPFGAVIVRDGAVIARGRNLGRTDRDPTAHGEMVAIRRCLADHGPAALRGSTLYTSGEPCAMCMGAILWCHFGRMVFAASVDATRYQDRSDHDYERRARRQGALRPDLDHRRRAGGRGDGAVCEVARASCPRSRFRFIAAVEMSMIAIRAAKAATVAAIALFASLVTFGNLTDYNTNFVFVEHVMSMDTIFPFSTIKYRAITSPALHHAAYAAHHRGGGGDRGAVLDRRGRCSCAGCAPMRARSIGRRPSPWPGSRSASCCGRSASCRSGANGSGCGSRSSGTGCRARSGSS